MNLTANQLLIVILAFAIFHVALVIIGSKWSVVSVLATLFVLLSPASAAVDFWGVEIAKYARTYVAALICLAGLYHFQRLELNKACYTMLAFVLAYVLAASWSGEAIAGFVFKGLFGVTVVAGLITTLHVRDMADLQRLFRMLVCVGAVGFALFCLLELIRDPAAISHIGRLAVMGMNPNRVGETAAPLILICAAAALYDPSKLMRIVAYAAGTALTIIIIYTCSRGALGMAVIGAAIVAVPLLRRPGLVIGLLVFTVFVGYLVAGFIPPDAAVRMSSYDFDSRQEIWNHNREVFMNSPIIGHGWHYMETDRIVASSTNAHSIYWQIAVEMGVVGLLLFGVVVLIIASRALNIVRHSVGSPQLMAYTWTAIAILVAVMLHGIVESGTVMGSSINALLLGIGVGLLDLVGRWQRQIASQPIGVYHTHPPHRPTATTMA